MRLTANNNVRKRGNIFAAISIFIVLLYSFNIGLISALPNSMTIQIILLLFSLVFTVFAISKQSKITKKDIFLLIALMFGLGAICIRNRDLEHSYLTNIVQTAFIAIECALLRKCEGWGKYFSKILELLFLEHIICTFYFSINRSFYEKNIIPLFLEKHHNALIYQFTHRQAAGLTANYSHNAMYLSLASIYFFAKTLFGKNEKKNATIALFIASLCALLLTAKRGPLLFVVVTMAITVLYYLLNTNKINGDIIKRKLRIVGIIVMPLLSIALIMVPDLTSVLDRIDSSDGDITSGRSVMYDRQLELIEKSPLIGVGWGGVKYNNDGQNGHNVYLQVLAECGILGFVVYLLALFLIWRSIRYRKGNKALIAQMLAISYYVFYILYSFTGNPLYDIQILYPTLLSIVLAANQKGQIQ